MPQAVVLLFLGGATALPPASLARVVGREQRSVLATIPPRSRPALESWAQARWLRLTAPLASDGGAVTPDTTLVAELEKRLEHARLAIARLKLDQAGRLLSEVESALLDAPQRIPQGAWLMAEQLRLRAALMTKRRPEQAGTGAANRLLQRAVALEGPRAPTLTERQIAPPPARVRRIEGVTDGDRLWWNGHELASPNRVEAADGLHHVRVRRSDGRFWAAWIDVRDERVFLDLPAPRPCSRTELERTRLVAGRVRPMPGTRCPSWAVAWPAGADAVLVARCRADRCEPTARWTPRLGPSSLLDRPQPRPAARPIPWAAWVMVGLGAGTATAFAVTTARRDPDPARPGGFVFFGP